MNAATATRPDRILIVDDSPLERRVYRDAFASRGFAADEVESGEAALVRLTDRRYELVLLDLNMPGLDGFAVLKEARQLYSRLELPVVILTASESSEDIVKALHQGANDYVHKSANVEVLLARVGTQLAFCRQTRELETLSQAIRKSQADLQSIVDSFDDLMFVVNPEGAVVRANRAAATFVNLSFRMLLGRRISEFFPDIAWERVLSGEAAEIETRSRMFTITPQQTVGDDPTDVIVVFRDCTDARLMTQRLERLVVARTTELRRLLARMDSVREREQGRLARELHDEFGQSLTAAKLDVAWIQKHDVGMDRKSQEALQSLRETIDRLARQVHDVAASLRPTLLDRLGLFDALRWLVESLEKRSDIELRLELPDPEPAQLSPATATALYRVTQESLTNALKHGRPSRIDIDFRLLPNAIQATVADDGIGVGDSQNANVGTGILGMRERVEALGGSFEVISQPGRGTSVVARLPLSETTSREEIA